jgi:hypothetical protein
MSQLGTFLPSPFHQQGVPRLIIRNICLPLGSIYFRFSGVTLSFQIAVVIVQMQGTVQQICRIFS